MARARDTELDRRRAASGPARLRAAIDSSRTRDKVPGFDPAAAPLGTDEESAGTPSPLPGDDQAQAGPSPGSAELAADPSGTARAGYRMQDRMILPAILIGLGLLGIGVAAAALLGG